MAAGPAPEPARWKSQQVGSMGVSNVLEKISFQAILSQTPHAPVPLEASRASVSIDVNRFYPTEEDATQLASYARPLALQ